MCVCVWGVPGRRTLALWASSGPPPVCVCVRVWVGECVRLCMRECVYVFVLWSGEER